jgi:hypothetical protein
MSKVKSPFTVLRLTFNLFKLEHQQIFYPFIIIVFINLFVLEILYFSPRYPLSIFFAPIVSRIWGEEYMHYPMNLMLLPKVFYYAQMVIFLFFSSILTALVADMVSAINNEKTVDFKSSLRKSLPGYVYIVIYSLLSLLLFQAFDSGYGLLMHRAFKIHSTTGVFFWIKQSIVYVAPYGSFLYSIFVTALLIYIPVLIILEKKKFLGAFLTNFKVLFGSFWLTFALILIPTLFHIPLLLIRDNVGSLAKITSPEIQVAVIVLSVFVTTAINIFIMATVTTYYLYKKENS